MMRPWWRSERFRSGVREVLERRLARLPKQTNAVLLVAAVAGREFDLDLVETVTGLDDERALEAVEAAVVAGLVVEDDEAMGCCRFSHGLVREMVYERPSRTRRARLHARVGEALVDLHGRDDPEHLLELARHAWAALSVTGADVALPYVLAAADHAMARLAFDQAEQLAGRPGEALRLLDDALAEIDRSGERYFEAELHRLKGESLLAASPPQVAAAEATLATAIAVAKRQGAKLLQERATASLGRLRAAQQTQSAR
jgi:predicted ATPase